jgi:midasin
MEVDTVPIEEVSESSPRVDTHPLALDLNKRCTLLLQDLGVASSSKPRLPINVAQVVFDYAFNPNDKLSVAALLESLSGMMAVDGLSNTVISAFGPILPDLLARWLENADSLSAEDWESRLVTIAGLAALRPDLWTYVPWFYPSSKADELV